MHIHVPIVYQIWCFYDLNLEKISHLPSPHYQSSKTPLFVWGVSVLVSLPNVVSQRVVTHVFSQNEGWAWQFKSIELVLKYEVIMM